MRARTKALSNLKNERGIAMLLVMSSLVFLTILLATFSYDTELNRIRTSNIQEKLNAKLNAESGLKFALAKLKIYQLLINKLERNARVKSIVKPGMMESLILQPFMYPIPLLKEMNIIQKAAIREFEESVLIQGSVNVIISKVSGFINPNNMIIRRSNRVRRRYVDIVGNEKAKRDLTPPASMIQDRLIDLLTKLIKEKKDKDEEFASKHEDISPFNLVQELRFYISSKRNITYDISSHFQPIYDSKGITPKHAPLNSLDELYLLAGWTDDIVDLVKDHLTVHESSTIQVNEMNEEQLTGIFPEIEKEQVKEFFIYRDGNEELEEESHPFSSTNEFKGFLVNNLGLSEEIYRQRVEELLMAGIHFDTTGKLYKVVSTGEFNRAKYKITAFIDLPIKPPPPIPIKRTKDKAGNKDGKDSKNRNEKDNTKSPPKNDNEKKPSNKKKKRPKVLLKPRIVEIQIS